MDSRRGRPPHPDILTPRQWEVLELVRQGKTNPEIGRSLGISPDGAKFHVSEIITKLGVRDRGEAARWQRERERTTASLRLMGRRSRLSRRRRYFERRHLLVARC